MTIDELQAMLINRGIEKLSISSPVYTMRDEPTRETERGKWQVSVKPNDVRLSWERGKWCNTLEEAVVSCIGPFETAKPGPSETELLV